jgi:antibiotic biosynthesis monooxygenase
VLVVNRFVVPADEESVAAFTGRAGAAIEALAARPGYLDGRLGRAYDDPTRWSLVTEWESVGAYRRALSSYDVKLRAVPVMYRCVDEPTAFEDLVTWDPAAGAARYVSDAG